MSFVFSTAAHKVVCKQRKNQIGQSRKGLKKSQKNVARRSPYSDEASVARRVNRLLESKDAVKYFSWKMVKLTKQQQKNLRSPHRGSRPPIHRFNQRALREDEEYDGYTALVTAVPPQQLSGDALFTNSYTASRLIVDSKGRWPFARCSCVHRNAWKCWCF